MYSLTDDQRKELVQKESNIKEAALAVMPQVREVIKKFDNKVFSKRLETELKKIDPKIRVHCEYNSFDIIYSAWDYEDRSITVNGGTYYIRNDSVYIVGMCIESGYASVKPAFDSERRILADNMLANMDMLAEQTKAAIVEITHDLDHIEAYRANKIRLQKEIKEHNDFIHYTVREYFELEVK